MSGFPTRYGCVLFDDPHRHQEAWACTHDGEPIRVTGTADLHSDTTWITNLGYDLAYQSGLSGHSRFRRADFFATSGLLKFFAEVGIPDTDRHRQAWFAARMFRNVSRLSEHLGPLLGLNKLPIDTLRRGIGAPLIKILRDFQTGDVLPPGVVSALAEADSSYTRCEAVRTDDPTQFRSLRIPRLLHANQLLKRAMVPPLDGPWEFIDHEAIPKFSSRETLRDWLLQLPGPALVRVTMQRCDPQVNELLNFGVGIGTHASARNWVAASELAILSHYSDWKVLGVYLCRTHRTLPQVPPLLMTSSMILSLSVGLVMDATWRGAISGISRLPNPWAPFLRAEDRLMCLQAAMAMKADGLTVVGYGAGKVQLQTPEGISPKDHLVIARMFGMLPDPCGLPSGQDPDATTELAILQGLLARGDYESLLRLDDALVDTVLTLPVEPEVAHEV